MRSTFTRLGNIERNDGVFEAEFCGISVGVEEPEPGCIRAFIGGPDCWVGRYRKRYATAKRDLEKQLEKVAMAVLRGSHFQLKRT